MRALEQTGGTYYIPPTAEAFALEAETRFCTRGEIRSLHVTYGAWDDEEDDY